jgi:7,8-dihydroneopterin aldolase/epimerase/oxygenase
MAIVALEGMRFFAHHGVFEHERKDGNDFEVDVWADLGNGALVDTDILEDTLNYGDIYAVVAEVMAEPKHLLETLVHTIGKRLVQACPQALYITVRVSKENPPLQGICKRSYVEETFSAP